MEAKCEGKDGTNTVMYAKFIPNSELFVLVDNNTYHRHIKTCILTYLYNSKVRC